MGTFSLWAAIRTVKSRIGTWEGYRLYNEVAENITEAEWSRAIGQARAALANRVSEVTRPLNRRPQGSEITIYDSKKARGYLQQIEVYVRDNDTGIIEARPYVVKTDTLRSRQFIVNEGLERYQAAIDAHPEDYPEEVLGAAYVGTHHLIPVA